MNLQRRERTPRWREADLETIAQYEAVLAAQGGGRFICGRPPRDDIALHVDHDHSAGQVRGVLCFCCNKAMADLREDRQLLQKAAAYLDLHTPGVAEEMEVVRKRALSLRAG